nr:hypothetical protein BaRGS_004293 [Batillaria attramentaria]
MEHMLPLEEIADQLNRKHYLKLADYRDITSSRMCEIDKWWRIFESLRKLGGKSDAHGIIGAKLEEFEIPVPPDLKHILAAGVPCMCRPTSEEVNPFLEKLSESGELVTDKTMKNED